MINKICFITTLFFSLSFSQDYLWPVKAKKEITAVFGEERPGRYHTGVDVRTFGETGYHLVAIDDGYIARIRTSSKGYGKTIYLRLHDGNTAVYAHLDHFTPKVDNLVHALHEEYGKYTIDHKIDPEDYPVKKGDLIGYSGDTGGVSGPHLHFEIRDGNGQPVNPFQYSLDLEDKLPPEAESIAVIPLDENAIINGFSEQKIFPLQKLNNNEYVLADTIFASGNIGIAIKALDKITGQHFNFGIYSINLLLDAQFIYSMQYNKIDWGNASKIYTERSYSLAREGFGKYYHLFSHHDNQQLPFINSKSRSGFVFDQKVLHDAIIDINDFAGNTTEIRVFFVSDTLPYFDYSTIFLDNKCTITFNKDDKVRPQFYLTEPISTDELNPADYFDMGNNIFVVENINPPFNVLQISGKNSYGISSSPTFHMKPNEDFRNITGKFKIKHYEPGIFVSFEENIFSGLDAFLSLKKEGILYSHKLFRDSKLTLSSGLLSPSDLENVTDLKVYYESSTPYEIFNMELSGEIIYPDSSFQIELLDGKILISGEAHTFYDTTFIWGRPVKTSLPKEGQIVAGPYFLEPYLIPFNNEIQINMAIDPNLSTRNLGIYFYNQKNFEWNYLPSHISADSSFVNTSILSGEIFAVIEENTPPQLSNFIPNINGTYYSSDLEHISFNVSDSFSGLEGETDVIVKLDDNPVVFEFNSYQNKVRYPLKYNLKKGTHSLYVQASDKVGNRSVLKGDFFIK